MKFKIGQKIIDIIRGKRVQPIKSNKIFLNHKLSVNANYVSFGDKNPDKVFFVIYRSLPLGGMCSNIRWILRYLAAIDNTDLIPILDDINFKTLYSENEKINNTYSWWNYYFKPISNYSLEEVYSSKHVLICNGGYLDEEEYQDITEIEPQMCKKYFKFNNFFQEELNSDTRYVNMIQSLKTPTLGIQFRGTDMTYFAGHPTPATVGQMLKYTNMCLEKENLSQIFLATECEKYKDIFIEYYSKKGIKVFYNNQPFGGYVKLEEDVKHSSNCTLGTGYSAGKNLFLDLMCLANCKALLGVKTNILTIADFLTQDKKVNKYFIDNGFNFNSFNLNKIRWRIIKNLPPNHLLLNIFGVQDKPVIKTYKNTAQTLACAERVI